MESSNTAQDMQMHSSHPVEETLSTAQTTQLHVFLTQNQLKDVEKSVKMQQTQKNSLQRFSVEHTSHLVRTASTLQEEFQLLLLLYSLQLLHFSDLCKSNSE